MSHPDVAVTGDESSLEAARKAWQQLKQGVAQGWVLR